MGTPRWSMEFGETSEETLQREMVEETALAVDTLELFTIATFFIVYLCVTLSLKRKGSGFSLRIFLRRIDSLCTTCS